MQAFESVTCKEPGNVEQIDAYYVEYTTVLQALRMHGLLHKYGEKSIAQRFYNGYPPLLKYHTALYDSRHVHAPDIRDDYKALQEDIRNVKAWRVFTDAAARAVLQSKVKAFAANVPI